jgi:hypothetical protein
MLRKEGKKQTKEKQVVTFNSEHYVPIKSHLRVVHGILKCTSTYLTHKFTKLFDSKQVIASYEDCHAEQEEMMI